MPAAAAAVAAAFAPSGASGAHRINASSKSPAGYHLECLGSPERLPSKVSLVQQIDHLAVVAAADGYGDALQGRRVKSQLNGLSLPPLILYSLLLLNCVALEDAPAPAPISSTARNPPSSDWNPPMSST